MVRIGKKTVEIREAERTILKGDFDKGSGEWVLPYRRVTYRIGDGYATFFMKDENGNEYGQRTIRTGQSAVDYICMLSKQLSKPFVC